jgi:hypothetical protein
MHCNCSPSVTVNAEEFASSCTLYATLQSSSATAFVISAIALVISVPFLLLFREIKSDIMEGNRVLRPLAAAPSRGRTGSAVADFL